MNKERIVEVYQGDDVTEKNVKGDLVKF